MSQQENKTIIPRVRFAVQEEVKVILIILVAVISTSLGSMAWLNNQFISRTESKVLEARVDLLEKHSIESARELKELKELNMRILVDLGIIKDKLSRP